ncbi:MAG TPA: hypothetical protein VM782_21350 [Stellaceae bacterium]|nr:hypothetical protein [Stellaceae bacterium]
MRKLNAEKAAQLRDMLVRYMRARHRFKGRRPAAPGSRVGAAGKCVEPDANPPIAFDGKADDMFEALIKKKYRAIPFWDPLLVATWRHYVIGDGPLPRRPGAPRPALPAISESTGSAARMQTKPTAALPM